MSAARPLYVRLLHLQHVHPTAVQRALLGEGALFVAALHHAGRPGQRLAAARPAAVGGGGGQGARRAGRPAAAPYDARPLSRSSAGRRGDSGRRRGRTRRRSAGACPLGPTSYGLVDVAAGRQGGSWEALVCSGRRRTGSWRLLRAYKAASGERLSARADVVRGRGRCCRRTRRRTGGACLLGPTSYEAADVAAGGQGGLRRALVCSGRRRTRPRTLLPAYKAAPGERLSAQGDAVRGRGRCCGHTRRHTGRARPGGGLRGRALRQHPSCEICPRRSGRRHLQGP